MSSPPADAARDRKIFLLWCAGISLAELAERFGLKPRYVERIVNRAKASAQAGKEPSQQEAQA